MPYHVIVRDSDQVLVGIGGDATDVGASVGDGYTLRAVSAQEFRSTCVRGLVASDGRHRWKIEDDDIRQISLEPEVHLLYYEADTGIVRSRVALPWANADRAGHQFVAGDGRSVYVATAEEATAYASRQGFPGADRKEKPRWKVIDGQLVELEDDRKLIRFTPDSVSVPVGTTPAPAVTVEVIGPGDVADVSFSDSVTLTTNLGRKISLDFTAGVSLLTIPTGRAMDDTIKPCAACAIPVPLRMVVYAEGL